MSWFNPFGMFGGDYTPPPSSTAVTVPIQRDPNAPAVRSPGGEDARVAAEEAEDRVAAQEEAERNEVRDAQQVQTVASLMQIMNSDDFLPNDLSSFHVPTYKFKLFMTDEREIMTRAQHKSLDDIYRAIDSLPQAVLAETGVTAGFAIDNVIMEELVSPGFQNRNTGLSNLKITITEPGGSSFIEMVSRSAAKLKISNYQTYWYYLELMFQGYDADGNLTPNALAESGLPSGGRWIYQISITNCEVHMDEKGATYALTCRPFALNAFEDTMVGTLPDNLTVSGATMGEFFTNFGTELTEAYKRRYNGKLFNFKFNNRPMAGGANVDPNNFRLQQTELDPINTASLSLATSGSGVTAQLPMGTRVSDVIDFLWVSCEDAQKLMLDTKSPNDLQDSDGKWNGKDYRESIVPKIEPEVRVTGFDPITNMYTQDIDYNIWGYFTYAANISPTQAVNAEDEAKNVGGKIAKQLKDKGYLRKRYDYRYTGMNTEVIKFDLDFNFAFSAVLPRLTGHRADVASNSLQEKAQGSQAEEVANEVSAGPGSGTGPGGEQIKRDPELSQGELARQNQLSEETSGLLAQKVELLRQEKELPTPDPAKVAQLERDIESIRTYQNSLIGEFTRTRELYAAKQARDIEEVERTVGTFYSEDEFGEKVHVAHRTRMRQSADIAISQAEGTGVLGHYHRGGSLTGALLNQLYEPVVNALIRIDMEVKGDPYWLGLSNMERRAVMNDVVTPTAVASTMPDFQQGDNTFAVVLRFPGRIDPDTGAPVFRRDDVFNGLYRCNKITHTFSGGKFTQKLSATKLELAMLPANPITDDDMIVEEN